MAYFVYSLIINAFEEDIFFSNLNLKFKIIQDFHILYIMMLRKRSLKSQLFSVKNYVCDRSHPLEAVPFG